MEVFNNRRIARFCRPLLLAMPGTQTPTKAAFREQPTLQKHGLPQPRPAGYNWRRSASFAGLTGLLLGGFQVIAEGSSLSTESPLRPQRRTSHNQASM
jgi:hypothetical protein